MIAATAVLLVAEAAIIVAAAGALRLAAAVEFLLLMTAAVMLLISGAASTRPVIAAVTMLLIAAAGVLPMFLLAMGERAGESAGPLRRATFSDAGAGEGCRQSGGRMLERGRDLGDELAKVDNAKGTRGQRATSFGRASTLVVPAARAPNSRR